MTCVFECFQSHCHILKELHDFLHMMGFLKHLGSFIFSFVGYGLVTFKARCTFWGGGGEHKMLKVERESLYNLN